VKLIGASHKYFRDRTHFFAVASMAMRQALVNHANASLARKRGCGAVNISLGEEDQSVQREATDVLALDHALKSPHAMDPRKSRVVELRYFGGLSIEETSEALGVSPVTITRDWQTARAWLARELGIGKQRPRI
jgi:RNA polymerase sigma-70 factor, ECF subfamily